MLIKNASNYCRELIKLILLTQSIKDNQLS